MHGQTKPKNVRLDTIEQAGRLDIAFTTGILIGNRESLGKSVALAWLPFWSPSCLRACPQEVIIQNFRAQSGTAHGGLPRNQI